MKLGLRWLRRWVDPPLDDAALAEQLTLAGLEAGEPLAAAPLLPGVVAARIEELGPHPERAGLSVCRLDVGQGAGVQTVCGVSGLAPGRCHAWAPPGATLPGGRRIGARDCHGVDSSGLLCSYDELGLTGGGGAALPHLPEDTVPGRDLAAVLELDERILELSLTPDRGDCLGLAGLAREVAALNAMDCRRPEFPAVPAVIDDRHPVEVDRSGTCPRYVGRVLRGVDAGAPTPAWMVERLRRSGQRSINAIVDVTNYVMLELGQPLHAFDLADVAGPIRVRLARPGEALCLLGGERVEPAADCLLIADDSGPLALAGIMGGERAGVTPDTRDVFLESALFLPAAVRGRAWRYGLHTESSVRFERGVDPALQRPAMERAASLVLELCGGRPGPSVEESDPKRLPRRPPVRLRRRWLEETLGVHVPDGRVQAYLERLEMGVEPVQGGWRVTPPGHRYDLELDVDLAGEVARLHGYDQLPAAMPTLSLSPDGLAARAADCPARSLQRHLLAHGYCEVVTYSFIDREHAAAFGDSPGLVLSNPLSEQAAVMRRSLWPGLLQVLRYNRSRQCARVRIFEYGAVYRQEGEEPCLGGLVLGPQWEEQWGAGGREADFYDVKRELASWLPPGSRWQPAAVPGLHPGRGAEIRIRGRCIGLLGHLHPAEAARLDLPAPWLFELYPRRFPGSPAARYEPPPRFPSARRDLALVVEESVQAQDLVDTIQDKYGHLIAKTLIFDVFRGKILGKDRKSLAIGLIFQKKSSTLTDRDMESAMADIQATLKQRWNAELRSRD